MDDVNFDYDKKSLTCCSLILQWGDKDKDQANPQSFELFKREGCSNFISNKLYSYDKIYEGLSTSFKVNNLKSNQEYDFKLKIKKSNSAIEKSISVKTLVSPHAVLSEKSFDIANKLSNEPKNNEPINITDAQEKLIQKCAQLIFKEGEETMVKADYDGLIIKITHTEKNKDTYYVLFDIKDNYFNTFFKQFIINCENNILIPANFIIEKLPTLLFLNLLEKARVIFTGKRMGGVIASSLVFYLLYIGKTINKNFNNAFIKNEKNSLGVITFGSPSFITNLSASEEMKEFTSYFFNIKEENDYIPEIIDFINKNKLEKFNENKLSIFNKDEMINEDVSFLNNYLTDIDFNQKKVQEFIDKDIKIPFGHYFKMKNVEKAPIELIDENNFIEFYYFSKFHQQFQPSFLKVYSNLSSNIKFNKESLKYLERKNYSLDLVKIVRRKTESHKTKGVIKFKLVEFEKDIKFTPDIIYEIKLFSNKNVYEIFYKDIYYDNDFDITVYKDDLESNVTQIIISNKFGGKITVNQEKILNIQGSDSTRIMLKNDIEKLLLFPFFKLFKIFYVSYNNEDNFNELKEKFFGKDYKSIKTKILEPFKQQIDILNELILLSRLEYFEKEMQKYYNKEKRSNKENFQKILEKFKSEAQNENLINESETELFISNCTYSQLSEFYNIKHDNNLIENLSIEKLMIDILQKIEDEIKEEMKKLHNADEFKNKLNNIVGNFYKLYIIPNVYLFKLFILSSIENGEIIKFKFSEKWRNILDNSVKFISYFSVHLLEGFHGLKTLWGKIKNFHNTKFIADNFLKDFEIIYTNDKIEEINMKNIFYKNKTKNIIKSNISHNESGLSKGKINKMYFFSEYSKKGEIGEKYYQNFLEIFNNYSNDFYEDIEISIYDNLREENKKGKDNLDMLKDMIKDYIEDEESKMRFLALLRQSYLLGKLRANLVRKYFILICFIGR